jgi:hypothetical protein
MSELLDESSATKRLRDESAIAKELDVEVKTLQAWRTRGDGPPFLKIGRLVKYDLESVRAWVKSRERTSTSSK